MGECIEPLGTGCRACKQAALRHCLMCVPSYGCLPGFGENYITAVLYIYTHMYTVYMCVCVCVYLILEWKHTDVLPNDLTGCLVK